MLRKDPSPPQLPSDCEARGTVQAWGYGEKAYHLGPFREAAQALGGNAVIGIRHMEDKRDDRKFVYEGEVVWCPFGR